jgi:hypothetical protein
MAKPPAWHPVTVCRPLREGQLPGMKGRKRQWRISRTALEQFLHGDQKPVQSKDE